MMLTLQQTNLDAQRSADARVLAAQEAAEVRARADAERFRLAQEAAEERARANKERFARLQETLICATSQQTAPPRPTTPPNDHVNLRRFRKLDRPTYVGPYQETKAFLAWIQALEIFFDTKKVTATNDKIRIAGTLIKETNLLSGLKEKIQSLKMDTSESFAQYETRARTLQRMINYDSDPLKISDLSLAEWLSGGLPTEVRADILKFEILETTLFDYGRVVKRVWIFFDALPARAPPNRLRAQPTMGPPNTNTPTKPRAAGTLSDNLRWRIHSYLDLVGRCHWCRGHCGLPNGLCTNDRAQGRVKFPPSYVAPPKPPNYTAPLPWSSARGLNPRPPNATAGQATSRPAGVAGVLDEPSDLYSSMTVTLTAAIGELDNIVAQGYQDKEEMVTEDNKAVAIQAFEATNAFDKSLNGLITDSILGPAEGYGCNPPKPYKTLHLLHKGQGLRGHIFTVKTSRPTVLHPIGRCRLKMPNHPDNMLQTAHLITAHTPTQFPILFSFEVYLTVS
ncbi:hypothetical protein PTTG_03693 [Puccinia triticina 1-1 BBBD Race 1]|uniref:Uncharacterized protein n=1 Tax=Puccinia triticina (isolate 1-1 / race 1 (BBBD)) TaxID=630390 RepID=A0A180GIJ2_PUCT1|nr:hypothetical protein PTTG_03693 [Puccinia triticina 1-1 BBBD Race 1]